MQVLKFGGTSIGTESQIEKIVNFTNNNTPKIVVFSAFSGVTNLLTQYIWNASNEESFIAEKTLKQIQEKHTGIISNIFEDKKYMDIALKIVSNSMDYISNCLENNIVQKFENTILAQGELLSSNIIYLYMIEKGIEVTYLPALNYMKTDKYSEPDYNFIKFKLTDEIRNYKNCNYFITNGYICKNFDNEIDNLGRGGSDYTATIIGNVLNADRIEIWTDIDGLRNNDPRYVENTKAIRNLSYDEACELAYFGATIFHPASIVPAQKGNIPILIKNSMNFKAEGTLISDFPIGSGIKAVSAKDGIATIKIKSGRMMNAYGFLRKTFEVFEKYKTPIDMLTTSEISVAMTIDKYDFIDDICYELSLFGAIEVERDQSIICVVGNFVKDRNLLIRKIIDALDFIPIQMISFGASKINVSLVIDTKNKKEALKLLNNHIFWNNLCIASN